MLRRKKTLEEKTAALIMAEFTGIVEDLQRDHLEYRRRLKLKEQTRAALEKAEAYYQNDEAALSEVADERGPLERTFKKAVKALEKARADFEKADFDEVAESFALKAKATLAEDGIKRRLGSLEEAIEDLLAGLGRDVEETGRALRGEYEEPRFDTDEERNAHVQKTVEILQTVAKTYTPHK